MNKNDQEFLIQKIRTQYTEKQHTDLDALKELDAKVKRPPTVFAYTFGSLGALVMGAGMSLAMEVIAGGMIPGIAIGCIGIAMVSITYPIYKRMLIARRKKYADQIIALSDSIMKG